MKARQPIITQQEKRRKKISLDFNILCSMNSRQANLRNLNYTFNSWSDVPSQRAK